MAWVGKSLRRKEDDRLIRGELGLSLPMRKGRHADGSGGLAEDPLLAGQPPRGFDDLLVRARKGASAGLPCRRPSAAWR